MAPSNDNTEVSSLEWLNNEFLEKCLKSEEDDPSITVISSEIKSASAAGDNYGSNMYRVVIQLKRKGQQEERFLIIKVAKDSAGGAIEKLVEETSVFDREIRTYTLVLRGMHQLLKQIQPNVFHPFAPNFFYNHQTKVIVLEDLKREGFRLASTDVGLDLNHCILVLRTIAKYHALSVILGKQHPENIEPFFQSAVTDEQYESFGSFIRNFVTKIGTIVNSWPEYKEKLEDKFIILREKCLEFWNNGIQRGESTINVLIHGDLWMNNMMFRYDEYTGDVMDVRFIDFQLSYWSTPVVDLLYFLNSSASPDVIEKFDDMMEVYYSTFSETLFQFDHTIPEFTLDFLNEEIKKRRAMGPLSAFLTRTVALRDRNEVPDLNKAFTSAEDIHTSEAYIASLKKLIPLYEKRGWLD